MLGRGDAPRYPPPERWLGWDFVGEKLRARRGATCEEMRGGRVGLWGISWVPLGKGYHRAGGATWPCTTHVWSLTSSDVWSRSKRGPGQKEPAKGQAEGLGRAFGISGFRSAQWYPGWGDGEQSLCMGLAKDAEKQVSTGTSLGYGEGSAVLQQFVRGVLAVPWASKSYIWPCKCSPRVPWGEGGPFAHCHAGLAALWLLGGLFLN